ncbi:MAG: hypothetical protein WCA23_27735 [Stellaceae bacterium]
MASTRVRNISRPVRVFRVVLQKRPAGAASTGSRRAAAPIGRPALAVLPFQNLGGDAEPEFFLDSVAEDLITELARAVVFDRHPQHQLQLQGKECGFQAGRV